MFEAKIENKKGNILTLSQNESDFQIIRITGLNPPNAQINTNNLAGMGGVQGLKIIDKCYIDIFPQKNGVNFISKLITEMYISRGMLKLLK